MIWRIDEWRAQVKYALSPPEQMIFIPQQQEDVTPSTLLPESTATPQLSPTFPVTNDLSELPTPTSQPTPTSTTIPAPLPKSIQLSGFRHEYQGWNNCGPATLAMALSYWDWQGDQYDVATITKPNPRDKNVMPYEMANYVESQTNLKIVVRVGGDIDFLKRFLAAGFPVIVEKGFEGDNFEGWMGHYELITGYDDDQQRFTAQDSYLGPNIALPYDQIVSYWRAFNNTYLIVFPTDREKDVIDLLGPQADVSYNNQYAAQKSSDEIYALSGRDQYFAWFNRGTNLVALQDYAGAAAAFDEAFSLYPTIPETKRPWRMMWYQTGPYWAYFYSGRYQDVINLASTTLDAMSEPVLEESYYWRALAYDGTGDTQAAVQDLQMSLKVHPGFEPSLERLKQLGVEN